MKQANDSDQPHSSKPLLIVMRHGERADCEPDPKCTYEIEFDPCLTTNGLQQAFTTGKFLKEHFNLSTRKIYVYCSPLLRTLQSAAQLLRALGLEKSHKITVRNCLIEELYKSHFPVDPLKNCLSKVKTHDYIREKVLEGIEFEDDKTTLKYPENNTKSKDRCWNVLKEFMKLHEHEENAAVILVSHGRMIDEFNSLFAGYDDYNCMYCAVSAAELLGEGKSKVLLTDYHEHIESSKYR